MALYRTSTNPSQMAQSAMNAATQAAASQTKQTTTKVKKEGNIWDDIYKGAASVAAVGRGIDSLVDAAGSAWDLYDQYKLRDAYDAVSKAFAQGGFEGIQSNPDMQDYWHARAVGQFVKDRAGTEKGRLDMLKSMDATADKLYQDWRVQAMTVSKAFQSGDMRQFMPLMEQLSAKSPLPYRLEGTEDGRFRVLFRSDQQLGWTANGQVISPQEAMNEVNRVLQGEQSVLRGLDGKLHPVNPAFSAAAARYYWGTVMGNAENRLDPKKQIPLYDGAGNVVGMGVVQNPVDDYSALPKLLVFDRRGRQIGMYDGMEGVLQAGMSPYKPAKQKGSGSSDPAAGGYKLSDGDRSALRRYCTRTDPQTGEDRVDAGLVTILEGQMRLTGLSADAAYAAYEENIARAMQQGASDKQTAERVVRARMLGQPLPAAASGQDAGKGGSPADSSESRGNSGSWLAPRMQRALSGGDEGPGVLYGLGSGALPWGPRGALDDSDMALAGAGGVQRGFDRQQREKQRGERMENARERARLGREQKRLAMDREIDDFMANADRYGRTADFGDFGEATDRSRALKQQRDAWGNPVFR